METTKLEFDAKLEEEQGARKVPTRADFLVKPDRPDVVAFDELGELEEEALVELLEELLEELPSLFLLLRLLGLATQGKGLTTTEVGATRASASFLGGT